MSELVAERLGGTTRYLGAKARRSCWRRRIHLLIWTMNESAINPSTSYDTPAQPPTIHIEKAGAEAARLLMHATPATYIVT
jgi:hypothetical protein